MARSAARSIFVSSRARRFSEVQGELLHLLMEFYDASSTPPEDDPERLEYAREKIERFLREDRNRLASVTPLASCDRAARRAASAILIDFKVWKDLDDDSLRARLRHTAYSHLLWELEAQRLRSRGGFLGRWVELIRSGRDDP